MPYKDSENEKKYKQLYYQTHKENTLIKSRKKYQDTKTGKGRPCGDSCGEIVYGSYRDSKKKIWIERKYLRGHHIKIPQANPMDNLQAVLKVINNPNSIATRFKTGQFALDKHPLWRGGISFEPYSTEFNDKLKFQIRQRDNFICQYPNCSITEEEHKIKDKEGRNLAIHHIDFDKKNCNPNNLVTLCVICNTKVNSNRIYWTQYFQTYLHELYCYKYSKLNIFQLHHLPQI